MTATIGQTYKQIKAIDGFPYNKVGENWSVNTIQGKYTVLKNGGVGLGVDAQELKEHFVLNNSCAVNHVVDTDDFAYEAEEDEYINDELTDKEFEDDLDNKQVSKFNSFLRFIGIKK